MKDQLKKISDSFTEKLSSSVNLEDIENIRVAFLGKKGELTAVLRGMGALSAEERPKMGQLVNEVRAKIEGDLAKKAEELKAAVREAKLKSETLDVTMPGKVNKSGRFHPLQQVITEMENVFIGMGYEIADGPEVEYD